MSVDTILAAGFLHETNTFATTATDRGTFQKRHEYFGETVPEKLRGTNTQMGDILEVADARDAVDVLHPVFAEAVPGGVVTAAAYEFYTDTILETIDPRRRISPTIGWVRAGSSADSSCWPNRSRRSMTASVYRSRTCPADAADAR